MAEAKKTATKATRKPAAKRKPVQRQDYVSLSPQKNRPRSAPPQKNLHRILLLMPRKLAAMFFWLALASMVRRTTKHRNSLAACKKS